MKVDFLDGLTRSDYCGTLRASDAGRTVCVMGWVQRQRDLGALVFVDLRDRTGFVQLLFDVAGDPDLFEKARVLRGEFVLCAQGVVRVRTAPNSDLPTGEIEILVSALRILAKSETPPFAITENSKTSEQTRLTYRYLDLRRPDLQRNLFYRAKVAKLARDYFEAQGFVEIETPTLIRSTPEGARDFLVPSRLHPGSFYALPQSPQLYKQLCMVAGFDRYVQFARCYRDEDLRADRQPEFTQIDLEMSFVPLETLLVTVEGLLRHLSENLGLGIAFPLPRLSYRDAMDTYGSDKPDTRYAMPLFPATDILQDSGFAPFDSALEAGGDIRGITAPGSYEELTRKEIDALTETMKGLGAKGLAWVRLAPDGIPRSSFGKFIPQETMEALLNAAQASPGDTVFLIADTNPTLVRTALGALRQTLAKKLNWIDSQKKNFLWVTDFPYFDWDAETRSWVPMHHAFTAPTPESLPWLESEKARCAAQAADLVCNGIELSSGSIRITDPAMQAKVFAALGLTEEETKEKFGFLLEAFRYGAPPHGGMGIGLDRLVMQLLGCENIRDVTAFPKLQNAGDPMTGCPAPLGQEA
jgi:aspartyl-tRNA synthetase